MEKIHFSIVINAPKEKVWKMMLGENTYPLWTDVFMPGSHFVGNWSEGSKMLFLAPDENGKMSGSVFQIKENRPYEFISLENIGMVHDGEEDISSEEATVYAGALENYTFKEIDGTTEVVVDLSPVMEIPDDYKDIYQDMWHNALQKLKELAEK
ncbi:MAG: SRPBCC domain-containing protein [Methanobacterium sp.]|nr:SRPBCC domain-containing protein [Methanobacterium sp.]